MKCAFLFQTDESTPLLPASGQAMGEKIGISQQTLVSNNGSLGKAKRLPQYLAALAATLGAVAAGMVLGWSSSGGEDGVLLQEEYNVTINGSDFSWIGSLATVGAGVMCIPIGILADLVGRKTAMLAMVVPFTVGWLLIIFSNSLIMFYFGRFITGLSSGAFCVAAPLYTAETSENEIRGTLGSYFQLMLTVGILLSYVLGAFVSIRVLSIISAVIPLVFFTAFFFMPESPVYYLKKGNEIAARRSLRRLRGNQYNIEAELQEHREALAATSGNGASFLELIRTKAALKGLVIAYGLMLFQQMSGVNAIIFYSSGIFSSVGGSIKASYASIIVGAVQVVSTFVSTLVVDKLGRRILLLSSIIMMCLMTVVVGIYYYCIQHTTAFDNIKWFAIIPVCIFLILFSIGFGPIPWMMMPEIFAPEVKGVAGSSACLFNWLMAFIVTKFYNDMREAVQPYGTFWIFSLFSAIGVVFVYFLVPETKGKTLDQIQRELSH